VVALALAVGLGEVRASDDGLERRLEKK